MDPNATYKEWCEALKAGDDVDAGDYAAALLEWCENEGAHPKWTEAQKDQFVAWCDDHRIVYFPGHSW